MTNFSEFMLCGMGPQTRSLDNQELWGNSKIRRTIMTATQMKNEAMTREMMMIPVLSLLESDLIFCAKYSK